MDLDVVLSCDQESKCSLIVEQKFWQEPKCFCSGAQVTALANNQEWCELKQNVHFTGRAQQKQQQADPLQEQERCCSRTRKQPGEVRVEAQHNSQEEHRSSKVRSRRGAASQTSNWCFHFFHRQTPLRDFKVHPLLSEMTLLVW